MGELQQRVGARIRVLRQQKGWTQEDLGARAELDFTTIGGAERGVKALSLNSLARVAQALGVELAWLVREGETRAGTAETEGLAEELLGLVRDLSADDLRHVVEVVKTTKSYVRPRGDRRK